MLRCCSSVTLPPRPPHPDDAVSKRSLQLICGPLSSIQCLLDEKQDLWDPVTSPNGWLLLGLAENRLSNGAMLERLEEVHGFPPNVLNYQGIKGVRELQQSLAALLERTLLKGHHVDPDHVCVQSGCSTILNSLFYVLCEANEGVLIPTPFYHGFISDLKVRSNAEPLPCRLNTTCPNGRSIAQQLDSAVAKAAGRGVVVRALLVTNPHNPTGTIYSDAALTDMLRWCLERRVHFVSDEIYGLSVFKRTARFTSAVLLAQRLVVGSTGGGEDSSNGGLSAAAADKRYSQQEVDRMVHQIYGLSKDWCASGLRIGMLYSRNAGVQQAFSSIAAFGCCSNHTQVLMARVLQDLPWVDAFLERNQRALEASYDALTAALEAAGIPYKPAVAGMFVWVDLRPWLRKPTWEAELELWATLQSSARLVLTPGSDCHARMPGWFRICFAFVQREALEVAVGRLAAHLGSPRA